MTPSEARRRPNARHPARCSARARAAEARRSPGERGFTLVELVAVVIIIGIFAALAIPQITLQLVDRRTRETAERVMLIYQQARFRALGQGAAVLVRYSPGAATQGAFEIREAMVGPSNAKAACALLPSTSCNVNWDNQANGEFRVVDSFDLGISYGIGLALPNSNVVHPVYATLVPDSSTGATATTMDICFRPSGQALIRPDSTQPFQPLTTVPNFTIARKEGSGQQGLARHVLLPPAGVARIQL